MLTPGPPCFKWLASIKCYWNQWNFTCLVPSYFVQPLFHVLVMVSWQNSLYNPAMRCCVFRPPGRRPFSSRHIYLSCTQVRYKIICIPRQTCCTWTAWDWQSSQAWSVWETVIDCLFIRRPKPRSYGEKFRNDATLACHSGSSLTLLWPSSRNAKWGPCLR